MEVPAFRFNIWLDYYKDALGQIDWAARGTKHPVFGTFCIIFGIIATPLYAVCASTMLPMRKLSVYKIAIYLAVVDILDLVHDSLIFGILLIRGEVYCAHPRLIETYSIGCEYFFFCSATGCLLLALNRFGELLSVRSINWFFQGSRTWTILIVCTIPCAILVLFTTPLLFNSKHHFMFFDPMIFKSRFVYNSVVHLACATLIPLASFLIYMWMLVGLLFKYGNISKQSNALSRATFRIIAQSGIIICIHFTTCLTFQLVQFVPHGAVDKMLYVAHFGWMLMNGTPPIVYLAVNKSIRKKLLEGLRRGCASTISPHSISFSLH